MGFPSSDSLYNFEVDGLAADATSIFTMSDANPMADLTTLVFQIEYLSDYDISVSLSYNGGSQALSANYTGLTNGDHSFEMGGETYYSTVEAFQWDLSGIEDTITDYTISITMGEHSSVYGMQLDAGNAFSGQVVPEPSTYAALAGLGVLAAAFLRRRKLSQK